MWLPILLIVFMVLTVIALMTGLFALARGGEFNKKYSNKAMVWRVLFQGGALVVLALIFLFGR